MRFAPTPPDYPTAPTSLGPLYAAIGSAVVAGGLLIVMLTKLTINFTTVLSIVIPAVTLATLLLALSLGWIFILIGRLKRQPAKLPATFVLMGITMIELLGIILVAAEAGSRS